MTQTRELFRIPINRTGRLRIAADSVPCQVVDLTEKGFRLRLERAVTTGEVLHLEFALTEQESLACTVKVTYARPPLFGALIAGISPHHQTVLCRFIDQINALSMTVF